MKIIVITSEKTDGQETLNWCRLIEAGLERLHVRKPGMESAKLRQLIAAVPEDMRKNLVVHHEVTLAEEMNVGGLHLTYKECMSEWQKMTLPLSCSVHSWKQFEDVSEKSGYVFISPVFDSVSKEGYLSRTALQQIPEGIDKGKAIALGGITPENAQKALKMGFGGFAVLGHVWYIGKDCVDQFRELMDPFRQNSW